MAHVGGVHRRGARRRRVPASRAANPGRLRRCRRPHVLGFFAFNKQAFCNYYYFVLGALCCAVAALHANDANENTRSAQGWEPDANGFSIRSKFLSISAV